MFRKRKDDNRPDIFLGDSNDAYEPTEDMKKFDRAIKQFQALLFFFIK